MKFTYQRLINIFTTLLLLLTSVFTLADIEFRASSGKKGEISVRWNAADAGGMDCLSTLGWDGPNDYFNYIYFAPAEDYYGKNDVYLEEPCARISYSLKGLEHGTTYTLALSREVYFPDSDGDGYPEYV